MVTSYELDLGLKIALMGEAAFLGEMFVVREYSSKHGLFKGRTYKTITFEGDLLVVEQIARGDGGTSFNGERILVQSKDLKGQIQFVSPEFVSTYAK